MGGAVCLQNFAKREPKETLNQIYKAARNHPRRNREWASRSVCKEGTEETLNRIYKAAWNYPRRNREMGGAFFTKLVRRVGS